MKALVIGSGLMGSALAFDLARSGGVEEVTLADINLDRARESAARIGSPKVRTVAIDVDYFDNVIELMAGPDCVFGAVSFRHNFLLTKAAIEAGVHFCDLGGNDEIVMKQRSLDSKAKAAGVAIVPNCGLAPGLANILAARGAESFESVERIRLRVGGLPQHPKPPLNYQLLFSVEGLLNEYIGQATILREGKVTYVDTMTEVETIEFPPPIGRLEAFHTSGGSSFLPQMFEGRVRDLDYKTLRYPGHCERFKTLLEIGFASEEPIAVGSNLMTAREMFSELLRRKLESTGNDVVILEVEIVGVQDGRERTLTFGLVDSYDENDNITAMMRCTAFPTSIIGQMIVNGNILARGVATPEQCVPLEPFLSELRGRKIDVVQRVTEARRQETSS